ncbi:MlaD family protein [Sagittula sp. SSi028]|uniref:MlaD family protein n=1 Tax=Sagittula sp. SSi028 TaxID=3400636 RepID=UPI003AF7D771
MTDTPSGSPRPIPVKPAKEGGLSSLSLVWLIPIFAVVAAIGVAWQNYASRGPLIEVRFAEANGVHAQETELRYRDIAVGLVEAVDFSSDLEEVIVKIRLDKDIAPYVDAEANFWIVRPEVTAQGVSGLDTVLSGVYIAGAWDGTQGEEAESFVGAEDAPLLALGEQGKIFTLHSENGMPSEGTPILYRGVQVGRMGPTEVSPDGLEVRAKAVILEPHTQLVTSSTRFWDTSGFRFSLGAAGANLDFSSLASLISGGVTFETLSSGGSALTEGQDFQLHPDEESAREDFFLEGEGGSVQIMMIFDENLAGLTPGADVSFGGLKLGEVETISGVVDPLRFGDNEVRLIATARINPSRIGIDAAEGEAAFMAYLSARVREGLRARLANASLLTGGLKIDLVLLEDVAPGFVDRNADPFPEVPTAPSEVTNVAASAQGLIQRVDALPVEEVMQGIIDTLADIRGVVGSEEVQQAPEALLATLDAIRTVAESEEVAALPAQVGDLADNLTEASATLNTLLGQVQDEAVVAAVSELIASLDTTAQSLPELAERASAVLQKAEDLPLDDITTRINTVLDDVDGILSDPELQAIPADVRATLASVREILDSPEIAALPAQVGDLAGNLSAASDKLNSLLEDAQQQAIVTQVSELIDSLDITADKLPGIADQASAVLSDAEQLSLDELSAQARDLLASVDRLVDQDSTRQLPAEVNAALSELRLTLEELRRGGVVANANAMFASARDAAAAVAEASRSLPDLSNRLRVVADQAGVTISGYNTNSDFGRELAGAIRQIDEAAKSIDRLAKQIARNPNSLITGR